MNVNHQNQKEENVKPKQKHQALQERLSPAEDQLKPQQGEGLYGLVRQDTALREYHAARLLSTPGYGDLSDAEASDMVEQMLQLSILLYEMLAEQEWEIQPLKESNKMHLMPETAGRRGSKQERP